MKAAALIAAAALALAGPAVAQAPQELDVVATFLAKPGQETAVRDALQTMIAPTRAEPGNIAYVVHQGADDPRRFAIYERWRSKDDLLAHFKKPYFKAMSASLETPLAEPFTVLQLHAFPGAAH